MNLIQYKTFLYHSQNKDLLLCFYPHMAQKSNVMYAPTISIKQSLGGGGGRVWKENHITSFLRKDLALNYYIPNQYHTCTLAMFNTLLQSKFAISAIAQNL